MELEAQPINGLDVETVGGLLADVDCGTDDASSTLAIHVYSKLAKTHKHGVIPYLPRIMASVLTSLCCSPQLHSACAEVVAALAAHTIDPMHDPASNEDVLRHLCTPLLSVLSASHSPHLATGAAYCLKSLVESDRWRWCAPLDLQELVCLTGTNALTEESNQTISHLQLVTSLLQFSSIVAIQSYGTQLLKAGMRILQSSQCMPIKSAAAELLQRVLKIIDAELLDLDISPILGVLQNCQQNMAAENMHVSCKTKACSSMDKEGKLRWQSQPCVSTPSQGGNLLPGIALKDGSMVCPGSKLGSTPSSIKSDNWLKRVPLAPLHVVNGASQKPPATYKVAMQKENIAPPYNSKPLASLRERSRGKCVSRQHSALLWPKNVAAKSHMEKSPLFSSPHTPIVPFRKNDTIRAADYSVNSLLEKHFGKERDCFEEQLLLSPGKGSISNIIDSGHDRQPCQQENQGRRNEAPLSCDQDTYFSSSVGSSGIDDCCETEGSYSPNEGSASVCETSVTSEQDFSLQVPTYPSMVEELLMTPKGLICSLQYDDDDYQSGSIERSCSESDAENSVNTGVCENSSCEMNKSNNEDCLQIESPSAENSVTACSPYLLSKLLNLCNASNDVMPTMNSTNKSIHRRRIDAHNDDDESMYRRGVDDDGEDKKVQHPKLNHVNQGCRENCHEADGSDLDINLEDNAVNESNSDFQVVQHTQEKLRLCFRFLNRGFLGLVVVAIACYTVFEAFYIVNHPHNADMLVPT